MAARTPQKMDRFDPGLHYDQYKGTVTLVTTIEGKQVEFRTRQCTLDEYADMTDLFLEAQAAYLAEVEDATEQDELMAAQVKLNGLSKSATAGDGDALVEMAALSRRITEIVQNTETRRDKSFRSDAPCLIAFLKMLSIVCSHKDVEKINPGDLPPFLSQLDALNKFHKHCRRPLVRGTEDVPGANGAGKTTEMATL